MRSKIKSVVLLFLLLTVPYAHAELSEADKRFFEADFKCSYEVFALTKSAGIFLLGLTNDQALTLLSDYSERSRAAIEPIYQQYLSDENFNLSSVLLNTYRQCIENSDNTAEYDLLELDLAIHEFCIGELVASQYIFLFSQLDREPSQALRGFTANHMKQTQLDVARASAIILNLYMLKDEGDTAQSNYTLNVFYKCKAQYQPIYQEVSIDRLIDRVKL